MPIISAASVFGRIGIQRASRKAGASLRVGLTTTKSMPAAFDFRSQVSSVCSPEPPEATCAFLSPRPPNATISFVCPTIEFQSVTRPVTGAKVPITCGRKNCAQPQE